MKFGLELPCGGERVTLELMVQLSVAAEQAGWDGVFFEDYLIYYRGQDPVTFDPWIALASVAAYTEHLTIGTAVTGLLARDLMAVARTAASVEALAPGRVVLGVGLGDPEDRGARVGAVQPGHGSRGAEMNHRLDLLLDLLHGRGVPIGDEGELLTYRGASDRACGVQVWVGGSAEAEAVARRAARADGIVPYKLTDTDNWSDFTAGEVSRLVADVAARRPAGEGTVEVAIGGRDRLIDDAGEIAAIRAARRGGATWWLQFVPPSTPEDMREAVMGGPLKDE